MFGPGSRRESSERLVRIHRIPAADLMFRPHLNGVARLRQQVRQRHTDLNVGAAAWLHGASISKPWPSRVRLYMHALCVEDLTIQSVLRDGAPLFTSLWQNECGPPDLPALRQYAEAVYTSTDAYLGGLPSDGLSRIVDLAKLGMGRRTLAWVTRRFVVQELGHICCEIAKGNRSEQARTKSPGPALRRARVSARGPLMIDRRSTAWAPSR
jgi:hypothetical protein